MSSGECGPVWKIAVSELDEAEEVDFLLDSSIGLLNTIVGRLDICLLSIITDKHDHILGSACKSKNYKREGLKEGKERTLRSMRHVSPSLDPSTTFRSKYCGRSSLHALWEGNVRIKSRKRAKKVKQKIGIQKILIPPLSASQSDIPYLLLLSSIDWLLASEALGASSKLGLCTHDDGLTDSNGALGWFCVGWATESLFELYGCMQGLDIRQKLFYEENGAGYVGWPLSKYIAGYGNKPWVVRVRCQMQRCGELGRPCWPPII